MVVECGWNELGSFLSGIGTLLGALAVFYAARVGTNSFELWQKQKTAGRRIELAEHILTIAYKIRHAFTGIRDPVMLGAEHERVLETLVAAKLLAESETDDCPSGLITGQAALLRVAEKREIWEALDLIIPSTKAVFGEPMASQLEQFIRQRTAVIIAAKGIARASRSKSFADPERHQNRLDGYDAVLWEQGEDDPFDAKIDAAMDTLEAELLPIIRAGYTVGTQAFTGIAP